MKLINKYILMLCLFLSLGCFLTVWAEESEIIKVTGTAEVYGLSRTPEEARYQALIAAREDAISKAVGLNINTMESRIVREDNEKLTDTYTNFINIQTSGLIVDEKIIIDEIITENNIPIYKITIEASVVKEDNTSNFYLHFGTVEDKKIFREGEEVILYVQTSQDCYLNIFEILVNDSVYVLLPNEILLPDNHLKAEKKIEIPTIEQREKHNIHLRFETLPDKTEHQEILLAVGTKRPYPFLSDIVQKDNYLPIQLTSFIEFSRWLSRIPKNERSEIAFLDYKIIK